VVEGDKRKLREAVANLVSNALKYSPPGEEVQVHVDRRDGQVQVAVVDSGPGLNENDRQRLFAPFQRLSAEPTGGESSSGLGLYIVKQVADLHEGTVDVETEVGAGSTFTLVLPATAPSSASVPEAEPTDLQVQE
jgi:signal transduction histidine kinase